MTNINRLVLGTVQLGIPYGIANSTGQPSINTALAIVKAAIDGGIVEFDTAQGYGNSEQILGECFDQLGCLNSVKIVSKLDTKVDRFSEKSMRQSLVESLERLRIHTLEGVLLHREEFLDDWNSGLGDALNNFVSDGLVRNIGVSVYSPKSAIRSLRMDGIDIVQIPTNIFDRRFEQAGVFELAEELGKTLYIRSIFLQGLVFMTPETCPEHMSFATKILKDLGALARRWNLSLHELSLGYANKALPKATILFGAETKRQVTDNIKAWNTSLPDACIEDVRQTFDRVEEHILNPALWS